MILYQKVNISKLNMKLMESEESGIEMYYNEKLKNETGCHLCTSEYLNSLASKR